MAYIDIDRQRTAQREYAQRNQAKNSQRRREIRARKLALIRSYKDQPCVDCEVSYPPYVMDFDHVRGEKEYELSKMANRCLPDDVIRAEIAKCDVVCANCHRLRHGDVLWGVV